MTMNPNKYGAHLADQRDINYYELDKKIDREIAEERDWTNSKVELLNTAIDKKAQKPENATYTLVKEWEFTHLENDYEDVVNGKVYVPIGFNLSPGKYIAVTNIVNTTTTIADKASFYCELKSNVIYLVYLNTTGRDIDNQVSTFEVLDSDDWINVSGGFSDRNAVSSTDCGFIKPIDFSRVMFVYTDTAAPTTATIKIYKMD